MKNLFLLATAIFSQGVFAAVTPIETDLYWYKKTLNNFQITSKLVESFLDPLKGPAEFRLTADKAPWAGNYYAMAEGGIASRWQVGEYPFEALSKADVLKMSQEDLRKLSPVEKFDIYRGDYSFAATAHEMNNRGPLREMPVQMWEGFCNGVRCAGLNMAEPKYEVTVVNKDGVKVTFLPADLKALAGAAYFYSEKYGQLGSPSQNGFSEQRPNPAVFDLALRYHLAANQQGFVIDTHLGSEIWNETVVGYKRSLREQELTSKEKQRFPKAVKKYAVEVVLDTLGEVDIQETNGPTKKDVANGKHLGSVVANYSLYVNAKGKAIDGLWWKTNTDYSTRGVDFVWFGGGEGTDSKNVDKGGNPYLDFKQVETLFKKSTAPFCAKIFM